MFHKRCFIGCFVAMLLTVTFVQAQTPLTVTGIADQGDYNDSVTFSVPSAAGYSYAVHLDGNAIPTDVSVVVTNHDYHQLLVSRTNLATLEVTNRLIPFIVEQSIYNHTERGYPAWTPYPLINATSEERRVGKECRSRWS